MGSIVSIYRPFTALLKPHYPINWTHTYQLINISYKFYLFINSLCIFAKTKTLNVLILTTPFFYQS